jgi:hypothetical protein
LATAAMASSTAQTPRSLCCVVDPMVLVEQGELATFATCYVRSGEVGWRALESQCLLYIGVCISNGTSCGYVEWL